MVALHLNCSTAALTISQKVSSIRKLVELKMLDFSDPEILCSSHLSLKLDSTNKPALLSLAAVIKARMKSLEEAEKGAAAGHKDEEVTAGHTSDQQRSPVDSIEDGDTTNGAEDTVVTPNPRDKGSLCNKFTVENESSSLSNEAGTGNNFKKNKHEVMEISWKWNGAIKCEKKYNKN